MKDRLDLSLYLVTDTALCLGRPLESVVEAAVEGGVTVVQLREKEADSRGFYEVAKRLKALLAARGMPLIINDRADIALAVDADGLHIGQGDLPYEVARRILGPGKIIGLSVETLEQGQEANSLDVDYIAASPVFATPTKTDTAPAFGVDGLESLCALSKHPVVAIGGIKAGNIGSIRKAGAAGAAVVSAIVSAESPKLAAADLRRRWDG